jgi:hypothetical protein
MPDHVVETKGHWSWGLRKVLSESGMIMVLRKMNLASLCNGFTCREKEGTGGPFKA